MSSADIKRKPSFSIKDGAAWTYVRNTLVHDEVGITLHILSLVVVGNRDVVAVGYQWNFHVLAIRLVRSHKVKTKYILDIFLLVVQKLVESFCQVLVARGKRHSKNDHVSIK